MGVSVENHFWRPLPLERLTSLPPELDGRSGLNLAPAHIKRQIAAKNDLEAINAWLNESITVPATYRTYRKEVERLVAWSILEANCPVSSLLREHMIHYEAFLRDPTPADLWCGPKQARTGDNWKPFEHGLSDASINQALVILNGCFAYLEAAGYLASNPLALRRKRRKDTTTKNAANTKPIERVLSQSAWEFLIRYVEHEHIHSCDAEKERTLFIFRFLYLLAPRLADLSSHTMNTFVDEGGKWWWKATGKGKTEQIPVPTDMVVALGRYRRSRGLPAAPHPDDNTPLVASLSGNFGISSSMIYKIVKKTVASASTAMEFIDPIGAHKLKQATTHWFRHTAITHMLDEKIDIRLVMQQARHSKLETTLIYSHTDKDRWHSAVQGHQLPDEPD